MVETRHSRKQNMPDRCALLTRGMALCDKRIGRIWLRIRLGCIALSGITDC
jgi:hypothetical protein